MLWMLSVQFLVNGPPETFGPLTQEECFRCALQLYDAQSPLGKLFPGQKHSTFLCYQRDPNQRAHWPPHIKRSPCGE